GRTQVVVFPLVRVGGIKEALIWIARELHRNRRSPPADLLHRAARGKSPPQRMAIPAKVFVFRSVVLPRDINVPLEAPHFVANLQPVCHPVACIYKTVLRQSHAMRQFLDVLFCLGMPRYGAAAIGATTARSYPTRQSGSSLRHGRRRRKYPRPAGPHRQRRVRKTAPRSRRTATRVTPGANCLSSSSHSRAHAEFVGHETGDVGA